MAGQPIPKKALKPGSDRLWTVRPGVVAGIIHGQVPNKSNSKRLVMIHGHPRMISGKDVTQYQERFETACWASLREVEPLPEGAKLYLQAVVWQENLQRDLDCELLPDLLQRFNIIKNDRAIWRKEYTRKLDRDNPRVEFEIGVWTPPDEPNLFSGK